MHCKHLLLTRGLSLVVLAASAVSLIGCSGGPTLVDVTGKVTYNGAPLAKPDGKIFFVGPGDSQVAAVINEDGTYKASKVTSGLNQVAVYYKNPDFKVAARPKGPPSEGHRPVLVPMYLTPEKYADVRTSELSVQVDKDMVFDVDMKGPPIP